MAGRNSCHIKNLKIPGPEKGGPEDLKKFRVKISIPTTGEIYLKEVVVNAINSQDAQAQAIELAMSGEVDTDDNNNEIEEISHGYNYAPLPEWFADVSEY